MAVDRDFDELLRSMKRAAGALREAEVPFALGGGLAVWARGGPKTEHDVDFFVKPEDAEKAQRVLADRGMRAERPPEGWLLKTHDGDTLVDLIFEPRVVLSTTNGSTAPKRWTSTRSRCSSRRSRTS